MAEAARSVCCAITERGLEDDGGAIVEFTRVREAALRAAMADVKVERGRSAS
jgi:hypothetical protein